MKVIGRAVLGLVVVAAGVFGVVWMLHGPEAHSTAVNNSQVLSALLAAATLVGTVVVWWLRGSRGDAEPRSAAHAQAAIEHLANETLRYWRIQAKERRIPTPSPASVRWSWASAEVAVPAPELHPERPLAANEPRREGTAPQLLTAGAITELREHLYERLDATRRRIVVLGGAGAGKTAAMLLLLIDILEHRPRESDQPVPVWVPLGGWNPETSTLLDWAASTLARDYPGLSAAAHGGPGTAAELIRTGRVALFLDGLDEMAPARQGAALNAIDRDSAGLKIVLTSRVPGHSGRRATLRGRGRRPSACRGHRRHEVPASRTTRRAPPRLAARHRPPARAPRQRRRPHPDHPAGPEPGPRDLHRPHPYRPARHRHPPQPRHPPATPARPLPHPGLPRPGRTRPRHPLAVLDRPAHGQPPRPALVAHPHLDTPLATPARIRARHRTRIRARGRARGRERGQVHKRPQTLTVRGPTLKELRAPLEVGLAGGLSVGLTTPAWQLTVVQMFWWLRGQRVRFLPLLQTALHRGVLRQTGAVLQFRHAALQDFLQTPRTAGRPPGGIETETPACPS